MTFEKPINALKATRPARIEDISDEPYVQFVAFVEEKYPVDDGRWNGSCSYYTALKPYCFYTKEHLEQWVREQVESPFSRRKFKIFAVKPMPVTVKTVLEFGE